MNDSIISIEVLQMECIRFIKCIGISAKDSTSNSCQAQIVYLRRPGEMYCMNTPVVLDDAEKFHRHLNGIPEEEYPKDELDDMIFNVVRMKYPDAKVHSTLLFSSYDMANLYRYKMMKKRIDSKIIVEPDFSTLNPSLNSGVVIPQIPLELYIEKYVNNIQSFEEPFWISCDYSQWINFRTIIDTKVGSMEFLSHYLSQHSKSCNQ